MALRGQPRVCCHGAVVGEATLALDARLAAFAASVESRIQVSSAMSEFRGRLVSLAGGASVGPRIRRAVVAPPLAVRVVWQLAHLDSSVTLAASAKEILIL